MNSSPWTGWPVWKSWLAAAAAGLFLSLAAPPTAFIATLWLGLTAFAVVLEWTPSGTSAAWIAKRPRLRFFTRLSGIGRGVAFGMAANIYALSFIPAVVTRFTPLSKGVALLALVLLAWEQSLRWALLAWVHLRLRRARVPLPLALAAALYISTFFPVMIPWSPSGGATVWPATVQLAETIGERGVDAVMAVVAGLLALAILARTDGKRQLRFAGAAIGIFVATLIHGAIRVAQIDKARAEAPHVKVALIAPAIEATLHESYSHGPVILHGMQDLTRTAEQKDNVAFSVWPEGSYPWGLSHEARNAPGMDKAPIGNGIHGPVVSGVITFGQDERVYNSATVLTQDGRMSATYDKLHLLWFGESVPLADEIPWLRTVFARGTGMIAGETDVGLTVAGIRVAVLNCFEDTLPRASREAATTNPEMLLNLTNDAWFSGTTESALHLRIAGLRSVELRRDLLRSVNGGLTSWYDAAGRLRATIPGDTPASMTVDAARMNLPPTTYARFGEWPMSILLIAAIADVIRRTRKSAAAINPAA